MESVMDRSSSSFRLAKTSEDGLDWTLQRNCSVSPAQLGLCFLCLSALSLSVGLFFWFQGAVLVLPFAALELMALATAFLIHARHAADRERISVRGGQLVVEVERAGRVERCEFVREWVRIEPQRHHGLVEVVGGGRSVCVGRFLRADLRVLLARELRQAVRGAAL
ncbi:MAG: putative membrane protein [Hydrogenophaga sp.]|jgi:uncharacterized membrane protein